MVIFTVNWLLLGSLGSSRWMIWLLIHISSRGIVVNWVVSVVVEVLNVEVLLGVVCILDVVVVAVVVDDDDAAFVDGTNIVEDNVAVVDEDDDIIDDGAVVVVLTISSVKNFLLVTDVIISVAIVDSTNEGVDCVVSS